MSKTLKATFDGNEFRPDEPVGLRGEELRYEALAESTVLPPLTSDVLARFVGGGADDRTPGLGAQGTPVGARLDETARAW